MLSKEECINSKKELKEWLSYELEKYTKKDKHSKIQTKISDLFFVSQTSILRKHQILLRKTEYYLNTGKKIRGLIYSFKLKRFQNRFAIRIPINTCGKGLKIMHGGPILVNGNAKIGRDCVLHIQTGIVAGGRSDDAPIIGDGVIVGIGAKVLGNVHIANGIVIGANAVVNKSFEEENIAIAGVPAKKISNNGASSWGSRSDKENKI